MIYKSFYDVKTGDIVSRSIGPYNGNDKLMMELKVTNVDDRFIYCGPEGVGWKFRKDCGAEVDEGIGWGELDDSNEIKTGSYLIERSK